MGTKWLCTGVSIGMMFTYLATFFWLFVESLHLYLLVVRIRKDCQMSKYYTAIGWVTPAVFVCVSAAMKKDFFERVDDKDFCWLAYDMWPKWLFVGPSVLIIAVSVILLFKTLTASLKMKSSLAGVERYQTISKLVMILIPIIGVGLSSSLLAVNEQKQFYQFIFTGCNAALSLLAVTSYCLLGKYIINNNNNKYKQQSVKTSSG